MRILHIQIPGAPEIRAAAFELIQRHAPELTTCVPLEAAGWSGASLLFPGRNSLDAFLEDLRQSRKLRRHCRTKQFGVPPASALSRPIIIVGAPRSGTTLLFETLAQCRNVWTIGGESHAILEPGGRLPGEQGNRLGAASAGGRTRRILKAAFLSILRDRRGRLYVEQRDSEPPSAVRFLEKTPKNSLRIPFLRALFPQSRFVFIHRDPRANIGSLIDGWRSPRFTSYEVDGAPWKFLLPPGWRGLAGKPVAEIATEQWRAANTAILEDLAQLPRKHWRAVRYEDLISDPAGEIRRICAFAALEIDRELEMRLGRPLPHSRATLTPPADGKWHRHRKDLDRALRSLQDLDHRVAGLHSV